MTDRETGFPSSGDGLGATEFADLMESFAPFERKPRLAVAVSGGADSLALVFLAQAWALARGGSVTGITVDHGLRPESADEARWVAATLARAGLAHESLLWREAGNHGGNLPARARAARYRLMADWCGTRGVLHLLVGHSRDDQAETVLLRLARGSAATGLAGMAREVEMDSCRIIRPLLPVPRARIEATLHARGQAWIEDPSNRNGRFARAAIRKRLRRACASAGADTPNGCPPVAGLARAAAQLADHRAAGEAALATLAARTVTIAPDGYATVAIDPGGAFAVSPRETRLALVGALLRMIGGRAYPPRFEGLDRLIGWIDELAGDTGARSGSRTLSGCRLSAAGTGSLVLAREARGMAPPLALSAARDAPVRWDGRFRIAPAAARRWPGASVGALGPAGWKELRALAGETATGLLPRHLPAIARIALPAIRRDGRLLAAPTLDLDRQGDPDGTGEAAVCFAPAAPLVSRFAGPVPGGVPGGRTRGCL